MSCSVIIADRTALEIRKWQNHLVWGRRIGDLRFETEGQWKRSGTTVDSLAKELKLALQYPEGAAM